MMKQLRHLVLLGATTMALSLPLFASAHMPSKVDGKTIPSLSPMLSKVTPAIVNITVEKVSPANADNPFSPPQPGKPHARQYGIGVGSGVIINAKKGLIVTNAHVVSDSRIILVTLKDGRRFRAKLVGKDDGFDIAIVRIPPSAHLSRIPFGDSDQLKVGDFVTAIGSPFGFTQTVTSGIISALNRIQPKIEGFQSFIQTDAPINPGNSGGALVNLQGQLIGINTAIYTPVDANIGIGFSIPSNMVHAVVEQLLKYGKVERGMLGVVAQNITPEIADAMHLRAHKGALVTQVTPGTPAQTAGFKPEDVITKLDGKTVHSSAQLRNTLGLMRPGTPIHFTIYRNHKPMTINATVGDPTKMQVQHELPFIGGMNLRNFNELEGDGSTLKGVLVTNVNDLSDGALAGIIPGDVITRANGTPIVDVKELEHMAQSQPKQLLVKVNRGKNSLFLVIEKQMG